MTTSLRILIVEDSDADAQLIIRYLSRAGFTFDTVRAVCREEYVAALAGPEPDLILADYSLPSFDGLTALALAKEACPGVPFIFVSGVLGEERAVETLKAGATDYVLKDRPSRLVPAVNRALEEAQERRRRREAEEQLLRRTAELEAANSELAMHRAQLQALSRRLVEIQEAERQALSRDLHDTAGQALTAVAMSLSRLAHQPGHTDEVRQQISTLRELTEQVVLDLRHLAVNLRPTSLDAYGLVAAVEQYMAAMRNQNGLAVELRLEGLDEERLAAQVETALYRIIQEALTNVVRHAQASSASVIIDRGDRQVNVTVSDDGIGCDAKQAIERGRLGLLGMRERAEMLGGALIIESAPGAGTKVHAVLPLNEPVSAS